MDWTDEWIDGQMDGRTLVLPHFSCALRSQMAQGRGQPPQFLAHPGQAPESPLHCWQSASMSRVRDLLGHFLPSQTNKGLMQPGTGVTAQELQVQRTPKTPVQEEPKSEMKRKCPPEQTPLPAWVGAYVPGSTIQKPGRKGASCFSTFCSVSSGGESGSRPVRTWGVGTIGKMGNSRARNQPGKLFSKYPAL